MYPIPRRHVLRGEPRPGAAPVSLTPRDLAVFGDLHRHRALSTVWLARVRFGGSQAACWERLKRLCRAGYVERLPTVRGEFHAYRLGARGKGELGLTPRGRPKKPLLAELLLHTMTVAEVADALVRTPVDGWALRWLTEQELLDGHAADWLPASGFRPDGVLEAVPAGAAARAGADSPSDGAGAARLAVEVELHRKDARRYGPKLAWYRRQLAAGVFARVRWYVPDGTVSGAVRRAHTAAGFAADDPRIEIRPLPEAVPVYGRRRGAA